MPIGWHHRRSGLRRNIRGGSRRLNSRNKVRRAGRRDHDAEKVMWWTMRRSHWIACTWPTPTVLGLRAGAACVALSALLIPTPTRPDFSCLEGVLENSDRQVRECLRTLRRTRSSRFAHNRRPHKARQDFESAFGMVFNAFLKNDKRAKFDLRPRKTHRA